MQHRNCDTVVVIVHLDIFGKLYGNIFAFRDIAVFVRLALGSGKGNKCLFDKARFVLHRYRIAVHFRITVDVGIINIGRRYGSYPVFVG